ncbi:MAG: SDR family oxidoreductase [Chloroflexota bacterium]
MNRKFEDKVVLITGAASGIGRETAVQLAKEGATLFLSDVNESGGQETAEMITQKGEKATFFKADVSKSAEVEAMVEACVAEYGRIDCAFNNAGIEGSSARMADIEEDIYDAIMDINVKGVWLCMKHQLPHMMANGGGSIVNTASVAGLVGSHSLSVYGASKHAVVGLTRSAAVEYVRKGIRINAVCPAVIRTPMVERGFNENPMFVEATLKANPMRRLGEADEVAKAVIWLLSEESSFTNGATITVDGGFTAQ